MARTVRDAAVALGVLAGADPSDAKTMVSGAEFHSDYTQFLDAEALKGKRIGFYTGPMGRQYKVDSLMYRAVARIKALGAEIVEVNAITQPGTGKHSFEVMLYEYKAGLNQYFKSLGPEAPIKNLSDLIAFNRNDSLELRFYNQTYLEMAQAKTNLSSSEYIEALSALAVGSKEKGIDRVLDSLNLDAFIAPTGAPAWKTDAINGDHFILGSSSPAAWAGYPSISVPMGEVDGLPVGISFFGTALSEPKLLGMAYAYEQATQYRKPPEFRKSD
jgi:amidase